MVKYDYGEVQGDTPDCFTVLIKPVLDRFNENSKESDASTGPSTDPA